MRRGVTRPENGTGQRRFAPLDGVRAVAIFVVMAYHSGIPGVQVGGFYGQDAFFVLSGLLITTLLLREGQARKGVDLVAFWGRRARRLLPALIVLLLVVALYVSYVAPAGRYPGFSGDALSALFYVSNWHLIAASSNYFAVTGSPSLLTHTWSLAIEEQYYLVWPLVVLAALRWQRRRPRRAVALILAIAVAGTVASTLWMAHLYAAGASPSRLYYGTDTHAQCLLVGSALAAILCLWAERSHQAGMFPVASTRVVRTVFSLAGLLGAAALCWLWTHVTSTSAFAYEGGFLCVAMATAAVLVSVVCAPRAPLARLLGFRPIAFAGLISYGMYLWYFPIFAVVTGASTGLRSWPLFAVRVAAVAATATASYYLVEVPLRTGRLLRVDAPSWEGRARPLAAAVGSLVLVVGMLSLTGAPRVARAASRTVAPPVAATAAVGPPVRILLVGDSTAVTLGQALSNSTLEERYHYALDSDGTVGCGLVISAAVRGHGTGFFANSSCTTGTPAASQWPAKLASLVAQTRPDVVFVVSGRWEMFDRRATGDGPWQDITQPTDAAYVRAQLEQAITIGSAGGAHVALATTPCFDSGEQPDGDPWPEDSSVRVHAYNTLVEQAAAAHPRAVSVVPLNTVVCPSGRFQTQVDGVTVRAPDGIHYPYLEHAAFSGPAPDSAALQQAVTFANWIAPRILPSMDPARFGPHDH